MAALKTWVQGIFHGIHLWKAVTSLGPLDWFLLSCVLIGVVYGAKKGFLRMVVEVFEICLVVFFVLGNYQWVSTAFLNVARAIPWKVAVVTAYFVLLTSVWAAILAIDHLVGKWVETKTMLLLKMIGGGILGAIYFFLILSLVTKGLILLGVDGISKLFSPNVSHLGMFFVNAAPTFYEKILHFVAALISSK